MKKLITLLLSLFIALGLASCDNNESSSASTSSTVSSSLVSEEPSSSVEVETFSTTLDTGIYVSFNQVSDLDLSELVTGDLLKFELPLASDTEGVLVCKINDTVVSSDNDSIFSYTIEDKNIKISVSGIQSIHHALTFTEYAEVAFVSSTEDDFPSTLLEGESVSFKVELSEGSTGTPIVKAGEVVLTADEDGVYTFVVADSDVEFTISGVTAAVVE